MIRTLRGTWSDNEPFFQIKNTEKKWREKLRCQILPELMMALTMRMIVTTKTPMVMSFAALFRFQSNQSHDWNLAQKAAHRSSFSSSGLRIFRRSVSRLKLVTLNSLSSGWETMDCREFDSGREPILCRNNLSIERILDFLRVLQRLIGPSSISSLSSLPGNLEPSRLQENDSISSKEGSTEGSRGTDSKSLPITLVFLL